MIDRLFTLTLTFAILSGASLAIGGEFFSTESTQPAATSIAVLPRVVVTGEVQPAQTSIASADDSSENAQTAARVH